MATNQTQCKNGKGLTSSLHKELKFILENRERVWPY